jgi:hypothetical protein
VGCTDTDDYMGLFWWSDPEERLGPAEAVAQSVAADLETAYPSERLQALKQQLIARGPEATDGRSDSAASPVSSHLDSHWEGWRWLPEHPRDQGGENTSVLLAFFDAYASDSWDAMAALFAPSAVYKDARGASVNGPERIVETFRDWKSELPEAAASDVKTAVANNDLVVAELIWAESDATTNAVILAEFEAGLISEMRHFHDIVDSSGKMSDLPFIIDYAGSGGE